MKFYILILVLILNSCGNQKEQNEIPYFVEKKLSFKFLKEQYKPSNNWIKQSNNILMLHETFKSVGYPQLLDYLNWTESGTLQIDNKRSLHTLIDSLALTYKSKEAPIYYKQFWERRASEGNKEVVYKVIQEIKSITLEQEKFDVAQTNLINDTLKYLAEIEIRDSIGSEEANSILSYLLQNGMHQSAWNVRSGENLKFDGIKWDTEASEIYSKLKVSDHYIKPWIIDNTK